MGGVGDSSFLSFDGASDFPRVAPQRADPRLTCLRNSALLDRGLSHHGAQFHAVQHGGADPGLPARAHGLQCMEGGTGDVSARDRRNVRDVVGRTGRARGLR